MSATVRPPEAFRSPNLFEAGIGPVIVSRFKGNGTVESGLFLVNTFCLGVKDAFFRQFSSTFEYENFVTSVFRQGKQEMPPSAARKLVEQAVAYAAKLGFAPHPDYKQGARVFGGIQAEDWIEDFTFGKDGKPFYISSADDTPERRQRIIATLERSCGPGNFHYLTAERLGKFTNP